jgi:glycosyltransferase involved in cell wall biosynthesis
MLKWVSVVISEMQSQDSVRRSVDSLLRQTCRGPVEVILVGEPDDSAWEPVRAEIDSGRVLTVGLDARSGGSDPNARRNAGLRAACGDVLCLTAADVVPAPDWIATGVALLGGRWRCAAPMASGGSEFPSNLFLAREVYERVGAFDPAWYRRAVDAGYEILCTPRLVAYHTRRPGWREVVGARQHGGRRRWLL